MLPKVSTLTPGRHRPAFGYFFASELRGGRRNIKLRACPPVIYDPYRTWTRSHTSSTERHYRTYTTGGSYPFWVSPAARSFPCHSGASLVSTIICVVSHPLPLLWCFALRSPCPSMLLHTVITLRSNSTMLRVFCGLLATRTSSLFRAHAAHSMASWGTSRVSLHDELGWPSSIPINLIVLSSLRTSFLAIGAIVPLAWRPTANFVTMMISSPPLIRRPTRPPSHRLRHPSTPLLSLLHIWTLPLLLLLSQPVPPHVSFFSLALPCGMVARLAVGHPEQFSEQKWARELNDE